MTFLDWLFALAWIFAALVALFFVLLFVALAVTRKERRTRRLANTEREFQMWLERNDDDPPPIPGATLDELLPPTHTEPNWRHR